jgi:hypothetical protein
MGDGKNRINQTSSYIRRTLRTFKWIWIISLFLTPLVGLFSILIISYIEISLAIDWDLSFTGKKL